MEEINSEYLNGICDYCGKNAEVRLITEKGAVKTREAEYVFRDIIKLRRGEEIVGIPKLCHQCFIEISKRLK